MQGARKRRLCWRFLPPEPAIDLPSRPNISPTAKPHAQVFISKHTLASILPSASPQFNAKNHVRRSSS
jgi:hypothetical protein